MPSKKNTTPQDLAKKGKKLTKVLPAKKPIIVTAKNQKTLQPRNYTPRSIEVDTKKLSKDVDFLALMEDVIAGIEIPLDDLDVEMLAAWEDFDDEIRPKLMRKNWALWAAIFSPVVLPGIVKGMRSEPTIPQPKVIIKGRQQEVIPPVEPRKIVDYCQEYFKTRGLELCKSLTETDLARLKDDLKTNWNKGPEAFAEAFKESYPVSKSRLETIYRSERHISEYAGVMERARNAGHSYKQYRCVGDERSCDLCLSYDMEIVPIDEPFSNGQMTPSSHPNCRCSAISLTEDEYGNMSDEEIYQDASYLNEVADQMKLNYKCEFNGTDNKCDNTIQSDKNTDIKITKTHRDIPSISWLESEREYAKDRQEKTGRPITGTLTSSFEGRLPVSMIKYLPGENKEHLNKEILTDFKAEPIYESIKNEGVKEPITIFVNYKGEAYISEGNHRTAIAATTGLKDVPVDVRYFAGGELVYGTWNIKNFIKDIDPKYLKMEEFVNNEPKETVTIVPEVSKPFELPDTKPKNSTKIAFLKRKYGIKSDQAYLQDVSEFMKLNYNCPDSEKTGSGPGSCSNDIQSHSFIQKSVKKNMLISNEYGTKETMNEYGSTSKQKIYVSNDLPNSQKLVSAVANKLSQMPKIIQDLNVPIIFSANRSPGTERTKGIHGNDSIVVASKETINTGFMGLGKESNVIVFWDTGYNTEKSLEELPHELIHILDDKYNISRSSAWLEVFSSDGKFTSKYAEQSYSNRIARGHPEVALREDLAESIQQYIDNKELFREKFINKYMFIREKIFNDHKQNSLYLSEVTDFIKQNKKCKVGTFDDTNACGPEKEAKTKDKLTLPEKQVVDYYQRTGYGKINAFLRNSETKAVLPQERAIVEGQIKQIESAISKSVLTKETKVFKGIGEQYGLYKNIDNLVGTIVSDPGFGSTSTSVDIAAQHARSGKLSLKGSNLPPKGIIAVMKLPQGTEALEIGQTESEVLVQHGTSFKVTAVDKSGPYWRVDMEAIPNTSQNIMKDISVPKISDSEVYLVKYTRNDVSKETGGQSNPSSYGGTNIDKLIQAATKGRDTTKGFLTIGRIEQKDLDEGIPDSEGIQYLGYLNSYSAPVDLVVDLSNKKVVYEPDKSISAKPSDITPLKTAYDKFNRLSNDYKKIDATTALNSYESYGFQDINEVLRGETTELKPEVLKDIAALDWMTSKNTLGEDLDLYRGSDEKFTKQLFAKFDIDKELDQAGINFDVSDLKSDQFLDQVVKPPSENGWNDYFNKKLQGKVIEEKGFSSFTTSSRMANDKFGQGSSILSANGIGVVFVMEDNKATDSGLNRSNEKLFSEHLAGDDEHEVILPRGQKYYIKEAELSHDIIDGVRLILHVNRESGQKLNSLLEDVADFMKLNYKCEFNGSDWKCPNTIEAVSDSEIKNYNLFNKMEFGEVGSYGPITKVFDTYHKLNLVSSEKVSSKLPGTDITQDLTIYKYNDKNKNIQFKIACSGGKETEVKRIGWILSRMPSKLLTSVDNIIITDRPSPLDIELSKQYGKKISIDAYYDDENNVLIKWGSHQLEPPLSVGTLCHELAHSIDNSFIISNSNEYKNAFAKDNNQFSSSYAESRSLEFKNTSQELSEDFADSVRLYLIDSDNFRNKFPTKYNVINHIIG